MIYTVTFNPSLDYVVGVTEFEPGNLHRTQTEDLFVGGKGINVSAVLKELGVENTALGFVAGFTGNEILHKLKELGISSDFITLSQGVSRINIKLKSGKDMETEINGQGPVINQCELDHLYDKLKKLQAGDFLVLSGNVPNSIPDATHIYYDISKRANAADIRLVVDAEGDLLRNTLCERPFLIKPNKHELEQLFDRELTEMDDICAYAKRLQAEGARNVLVTLGEAGAILADEYGMVHKQAAPQGRVLNCVGAGDSLIAGFLARLIKIQGSCRQNSDWALKEIGDSSFTSVDYESALKLGVAAGSAGAFSIGLPDKVRINTVFNQLNQ